MASPAHSNGRGRNLVQDDHSDHSSFSPISLRSSLSFSSSKYSPLTSFSLEENIAINSPFSPRNPLHFPGQIPFSWEKIPGIPKNKQLSEEKTNAPQLRISLLPLPPAAGIPNQKQTGQKKHYTSFRKDPFFAALVECSKGCDQHGSIRNFSKISRVTRTLTDRLGFMSMHTNISCKNTCAVSESMVYLPRSSHHIYSMNTRRPV